MPSHFPSSQLTSLMINLNVILHLFDLRPGYYRRHLLILHATPLSSSLLHSAPILEFSILTKQGPSCNILNFTIPLHSHHDEIQKKKTWSTICARTLIRCNCWGCTPHITYPNILIAVSTTAPAGKTQELRHMIHLFHLPNTFTPNHLYTKSVTGNKAYCLLIHPLQSYTLPHNFPVPIVWAFARETLVLNTACNVTSVLPTAMKWPVEGGHAPCPPNCLTAPFDIAR
jgi:hypothetical protein